MPKLAPLDWPAIQVQVTATDRRLRAMLDRVKRNFEFMGEREPHWSVITDARYLSESIESSEEEFFASGQQPVTELSLAAARCGLRLGPEMTCFELGCGVGRSTIWLADIFDHVVGSDVSAPHLRLAAATTQRFGKPDASFLHIDRPGLIDELPPFDVFFSIIATAQPAADHLQVSRKNTPQTQSRRMRLLSGPDLLIWLSIRYCKLSCIRGHARHAGDARAAATASSQVVRRDWVLLLSRSG